MPANGLVASSLTNLPSVATAGGAVNLSEFSEGFDFLPRIQLVTKGKYVDKGKISPGHYGVPEGEDEITDLGADIDILALAVRNKALDTTLDPPLAVYDASSEEYQRIRAQANEKDSGCMFGPSFLIFERNTARLYELFLGNKSGRQEASKFGPYLPISEEQAKTHGVEAKGPTPLTLKAKYIERPRYSWHAPVVAKCSTPITNLPPIDQVVEEVNKFVNAKTDGPERAPEAPAKGRAR